MQLKGIGAFSVYKMLTVQEMAEHLKCSSEAVYERALAGEILFLSSPARVDDRRYPAFQLDERLNRPGFRGGPLG